jgi:hypothetical protein
VVVEQNEFFRFARECVTFRKCINPVLRSNRFYQPDNTTMSGYAVVLVDSCGVNALVENNRFGGSVPAWGVGRWQTSSINQMSIIKAKAGITARGNEFGNIHISASTLYMIETWYDTVRLHSNRVGTADSAKSVTAPNFLYIFTLFQTGGSVVDSNFVSGVYGGGELNVCGLTNSGIFGRPCTVAYNDFGGADMYEQNGSEGNCRIMSVNQSSMIIHHNKVRGFKSRLGFIYGIEDALSAHTGSQGDFFIDNNTVNHLMGRYNVSGINIRTYSTGYNRISNNKIYALRAIAQSHPSNSTMVSGINLNNEGLIPFPNSVLEVSNNTIHSFDVVKGNPPDYYGFYGISIASSGKARAFNNVIRLGIDSRGAMVDSSEIPATGITVYGTISEAEHNSIYMGRTGGTPLKVGTMNTDPAIRKYTYVANNILFRDDITATANPIYMSVDVYTWSVSSHTLSSNNNLWYSTTDASIASRLAAWKTQCHCDSNTVVGNPMFVNPTGDSVSVNLHLQTGSASDATGTPSMIGVIYDRDSVLRADFSPVDKGAYALTPCANPGNLQVTLDTTATTIFKCAGSSIRLHGTVTGTATSITWQRNLTDIAGAGSTQYDAMLPGTYRLVVKNGCQLVASSTVIVADTSLPKPFVYSTPGAGNCSGSTVTLTAYLPFGCTNCIWSWNTGATGPNIQVNTGGPYVATVNAPGNCPNKSDTFNLVYVPTPAAPVITVTGGTNICTGTTQLQSNAANGNQWYLNGNLISGATSASYSPTQPGNYTVKTTVNYCTSAASNTITLSGGALALTLSASPAASVCNGMPVMVTANVPGCSGCTYSWNGQPPGNFNSILFTTAGWKKVTVTNSCGSVTDSIFISYTNVPVITLSKTDTTICQGNPVVLVASGANTYSWSPATGLNTSTGSTVIATSAVTTTYTVTGTTNGCSSTATSIVRVNPVVVPTISISNTGCPANTLQFTATTTNAGSFGIITWFVNNTGVATGNSFTLNNAVNGTQVYAKLLSGAVCPSPQIVTSPVTTINCVTTGLPSIEGLTAIDAVPNPGRGPVRVRLQLTGAKKVAFEVWDADGRKLISIPAKTMSGQAVQNIDLSGHAAGSYFIRVMIGNKATVLTVVINR